MEVELGQIQWARALFLAWQNWLSLVERAGRAWATFTHSDKNKAALPLQADFPRSFNGSSTSHLTVHSHSRSSSSSPPRGKPVRIQIEGPLVSIQKLLPGVPWCVDIGNPVFPQPAGPELAKLAYRAIYGQHGRTDVATDLVVRDEYLGWVDQKK